MTISVDDAAASPQAISTDVTALDFGTPRGLQDVTGINSSVIERIALYTDFSINIRGVFDDGTNLAHAVFKTVPSTDVVRTVSIAHSGQTLAVETTFTDYALSRAQDGSLTFTAPGVSGDTSVPTWS